MAPHQRVIFSGFTEMFGVPVITYSTGSGGLKGVIPIPSIARIEKSSLIGTVIYMSDGVYYSVKDFPNL